MSTDEPQRSGRTIVVVNPASGGGKAGASIPQVVEELTRQGRSPQVVTTLDMAHAEEIASAAATEDLVVSVGGDGILSRVAAGVVRSGACLAVVPGGRGNDFARAAGIARDAVAATAALATARERRIDVGVITREPGSRIFLGVGTTGFDTTVTTIANETTWIKGPGVYTWAALRALMSVRARVYRLVIDGVPIEAEAFNVAVGNSGHHGGGSVGTPGAQLDDGLLDVLVQGPVPRPVFVRQLLKSLQGTQAGHRSVRTWRARSVRIETDEPAVIFADGEPVTVLPVEITIRPGALRLLA